MEGKLDRLANEWVKKNPKSTLAEAFKEGYLRCTEAWVNQESQKRTGVLIANLVI